VDQASITDQLVAISISLKSFEEQVAITSAEWESTLQGELGAVVQQVQDLHGRFQLLESKLEVHDRHFSHIRPVLTSLSSSKNTSTNVDMSNLLSRLSALELKVAKGVSDDLGHPPPICLPVLIL
jgi:hypothetical protein